MSPSMSSKSFLDLPGELRNQIYIEFLNCLVIASERTPYEKFRDNDRCVNSRDYIHFLLANRQISTELSSLYVHDFSNRVVATTTNPARLLAWVYKASFLPSRRSAHGNQRFALHLRPSTDISNHDVASRLQRTRRSSYPITSLPRSVYTADDRAFVTLLTAQPGFRTSWLQHPGLHRTEPEQFAETDQLTMAALGMPDCDYATWAPEDAGFELFREESHDYARLVWPRWQSDCRLTTHAWTTLAGRQSCMVLEGRLNDLSVR